MATTETAPRDVNPDAGGDSHEDQQCQPLPSGMKKRIIKEGSPDEKDAMPTDGHEVSVHYVGKFPDGEEFDSSRSRGTPFSFTIGEGSVIKGWEIALKTMRRGEIAEFTFPPELAYGENGSPPTIPANSTLVFEIELLDYVLDDANKDRAIHRMSFKERLEKCEEIKTQGAEYFKQGKYDQAVKQYRNIMKLAEISELRYDGNLVDLDTPEKEKASDESESAKNERKSLKQMLLAGHLNLALCYLKLNNHKECIQNCNDALKLDSTNVKALFRKGQAFFSINEYEAALKQFEKVLEVDANNSEAKAQINACNQALRSYYEKQKNIYKNLFPAKT